MVEKRLSLPSETSVLPDKTDPANNSFSRPNPVIFLQARLLLLALLVGLLVPGTSTAQSGARTLPPPDTTSPNQSATPSSLQSLSTHTLGAWVEGSFASGSLIGNVEKAQIGILGLRYHRLLVPRTRSAPPEGPTLAYTADVFPVLFLSIPPNTVPVLPGRGGPATESEETVHKHGLDTYGFGASPAGLRITHYVSERIQPFIAGSAGLVYFTQSVPNERGKQLNFVFEVGVGIDIVLTPALRLTAGYRYHHLSNGFRGQINPGFDANLLHVGVSVSQ